MEKTSEKKAQPWQCPLSALAMPALIVRAAAVPSRSYWPTQPWRHSTPEVQQMNSTAMTEAINFVDLEGRQGNLLCESHLEAV